MNKYLGNVISIISTTYLKEELNKQVLFLEIK